MVEPWRIELQTLQVGQLIVCDNQHPAMKTMNPTNTRETPPNNTQGSTDFSLTATVVTAGLEEAMTGNAPVCLAGCDVPPDEAFEAVDAAA